MSQSKFDPKYTLCIYNDCYGGGTPHFNKKAKAYYDNLDSNLYSHDEKTILTIERFGTNCTNDTSTEFGLCLCPVEYKHCFDVHEYDGKETPYINASRLLNTFIMNYYKSHETMTQETYLSFVQQSPNIQLIMLYFD